MYFDSRHCINISPDIFTDILKKTTHTQKPPRNIDSHRQNIDVHTENASNLTDLTNRNKFTQVRRTEVRSVRQDHRTKTCPDVNSLQTSQTTHPATENVWPMGQEVSSTDRERTPRPRDHKAISDSNQTFSSHKMILYPKMTIEICNWQRYVKTLLRAFQFWQWFQWKTIKTLYNFWLES